MNKKYIIQKNEEIAFIVKTGKRQNGKFYIIYNIESKHQYNKYCVSVSKKLGKANIRNKMKRRTKDILMKNKMDLGKKYVIIIKKEALVASYKELEIDLINLIKGENK